MPTPLEEPLHDNAGVRLGVIELARVFGFIGMLFGISAGIGVLVFSLDRGSVTGALAGMLLAAASSCFDLFGEVALVRFMTRRFERRAGSALRGAGGVHALVNVEPVVTVHRIKRVPDEIAVLELVPNSGRLALEGVLGRAEVRAEQQPEVKARKDQLWPVVELHYWARGKRYELVLYQQPSFVRTFAIILGLLRVVRHPSERLADRMRRALASVALPGRNVPELSDEVPASANLRVAEGVHQDDPAPLEVASVARRQR
ncbi:MAG: hypothetical protein HYS27_01040 [Deltaproteobacteria bacterium]|nr:hypothetical protein [Deltaproteobacteria bacterium]